MTNINQIKNYLEKNIKQYFEMINNANNAKSYYAKLINTDNKENNIINLIDHLLYIYKKSFQQYISNHRFGYISSDRFDALAKDLDEIIKFYQKQRMKLPCSLDKNKFEKELKEFTIRLEQCDKIIYELFQIFNSNNEHFKTIMYLYDECITMKERSLYDPFENIFWYVFDNKFGKNKMDYYINNNKMIINNVHALNTVMVDTCMEEMEKDIIYQYFKKGEFDEKIH